MRVVNLEPDMTDTNLYRNADFTVDENEAARIQPNEVADAVLYVLGQREGLVMTDITIRPQLQQNCKKVKSLYFKKHQMPFERLTYSH